MSARSDRVSKKGIWEATRQKLQIYYFLYLNEAQMRDSQDYNQKITQLIFHWHLKDKTPLIKQFLKDMIYGLLPLSMIQFQKPLSRSDTCHHKDR